MGGGGGWTKSPWSVKLKWGPLVQVDQMWSVELWYKWIRCGVWNRGTSGSNVECGTVVQVGQMTAEFTALQFQSMFVKLNKKSSTWSIDLICKTGPMSSLVISSLFSLFFLCYGLPRVQI